MDLFNRKKVEELQREIRIVRDELERTRGELFSYKKIDTIAISEKLSSRLAEENQKLIKWIRSILDTFGTMEVRDRERIQIPILITKDTMYYKANHGGERSELYPRDTIIIPEIVISKMG